MASNVILNKYQAVIEEVGFPNGTIIEWLLFETQKDRLSHWLVTGRENRIVIYVVGMGGQSKTTLAKNIYSFP